MLTPAGNRTLLIIDMNEQLENYLKDRFSELGEQMIIMKSYGAWISQPYGCLVRNIIVATYENNIEHVHIIGENNQQDASVSASHLIDRMREEGISDEIIQMVQYLPHIPGGLNQWLGGYSHREENIKKGVEVIRKHPLIPKRVQVKGWLFDTCLHELKPVL